MRLNWVYLAPAVGLLVIGCSSAATQPDPAPKSSPATQASQSGEIAPSAAVELLGPIGDARAFATLLGHIAEREGDPSDAGSGDEVGDFGVAGAWIAAGWPEDGFGPASPTSIDVHPLRGADTVDVPFVAYAVTDTQGRCFLGALTRSPQDDSIFALVVPGVSYRQCTSAVAADEFGAIVGTIHGDQP